MGLGGAEMDKSLAEDIRAELEENRQYLVRALRAVETTSAECKEETREATLKAEHALAQLRSLEAVVAQKDEQIAGIREAGEEHIRGLGAQLEEQREQTEGLQQALEAQSLTIVDLREQVYALQLRVLKSDEEADRAGLRMNREAEDKIAAMGARVDKFEREVEHVRWQLQTVREEAHATVQQQQLAVKDTVERQDSAFEDALRAAEVKLQAQVSNSEALSALALEEMASRFKAQLAEVSEAMSDANGSARGWQAEVRSLEALLEALRRDWQASVQETKSEVEAMFKGEMMLTQRVNAMEGSIKGETSSQMAELETALAQATSTLQLMAEEFNRKDSEFRAKLDLVAEEIDKQSDAQRQAGKSLEEIAQQQKELLNQQQAQDQALFEVKEAGKASPDMASQVAEMVPKIEAMESLIQSLESIVGAPTPKTTPRGTGDSPRHAALLNIHNMQNDLMEHTDKLKAVEKRLDEFQNIIRPKGKEKKMGASSEEFASQSDIGVLQTQVQTLEKQVEARVQALQKQVEALSKEPDHAPARCDTAAEAESKAEPKVEEPAKAEPAKEEPKEQTTSTGASTTDAKTLDEIKSGLKELKQEHMNLYGRVVSMERAKKALDSQDPPDEPAAGLDQWAIEGRVSRVHFVWTRNVWKGGLSPLKPSPEIVEGFKRNNPHSLLFPLARGWEVFNSMPVRLCALHGRLCVHASGNVCCARGHWWVSLNALDHLARRLVQIELAMIDILEKQSSGVHSDEEVCLLVI